MTREEELLLEEATSAHRLRAKDGTILPSRAWADLSEDARRAAFDETLRLRRLESAFDASGLSSTARAVLARIRGEAS